MFLHQGTMLVHLVHHSEPFQASSYSYPFQFDLIESKSQPIVNSNKCYYYYYVRLFVQIIRTILNKKS